MLFRIAEDEGEVRLQQLCYAFYPLEESLMKKTNRILSLALALIMVMGCIVLPAGAVGSDGKWIATWGTAPVDFYISLADYIPNFAVNGKVSPGTLLRTELTVSTAGEKLRFKFSNEYGDRDVTVASVFVAKTDTSESGAVLTDTEAALRFGGSKKLVIPAGETVWSDEVDIKTAALERLTVSMYITEETPIKTVGLFCGKTYFSRAVRGNEDLGHMVNPSEVSIATGGNAYHIIPFLTAIDSYTESEAAYSAAFIGDSTLVNGVTGYISGRLVDAGRDDIGVINAGIMGNRLFYKGTGLIGNLYGDPVMDRFTRDALDITGCDRIIVKIGVNDILHPSSKSMGNDAPYVSAQEIIDGYKKLTDIAHENGKKIFFMEITPWNGYVRDILGNKNDIIWKEELQEMCDEVNEWIKTNDIADGYIDSDSLSQPKNPTAFIKHFTKDGIHFTEMGALAFADCIDVEQVFGVSGARTASEILGIDPYSETKQTKKNERLVKFRNVLLMVRQLLSTMRVEFGPLQKLLNKLIDSLPDGRELSANVRKNIANGARKLSAAARR